MVGDGVTMRRRWRAPTLLHLGPDLLVFVNSTKLLRVSIEPAA
jgi:hypothetical protein